MSTMNDQPSTGNAVRLTTEQVWHCLERASFAVVSYTTPRGDPRSSGIVYKVTGGRLFVAVAPDSWKARHIAVIGRVAVTVPVRRGGILSLLFPIPPATVSFHGAATVHAPGSPTVAPFLKELGSLLPPERRTAAALVEITPEGEFVTFGIGVSLTAMRKPATARSRAPVSRETRGVDRRG